MKLLSMKRASPIRTLGMHILLFDVSLLYFLRACFASLAQVLRLPNAGAELGIHMFWTILLMTLPSWLSLFPMLPRKESQERRYSTVFVSSMHSCFCAFISTIHAVGSVCVIKYGKGKKGKSFESVKLILWYT